MATWSCLQVGIRSEGSLDLYNTRALRGRSDSRVLLPVVTQEVITTREALKVVAAGYAAIERDLVRCFLYMSPLVPIEILRVQEAFEADVALVGTFEATEVGLAVTTDDASQYDMFKVYQNPDDYNVFPATWQSHSGQQG
jgi:uncharacterized protein (UPF0264 family)